MLAKMLISNKKRNLLYLLVTIFVLLQISNIAIACENYKDYGVQTICQYSDLLLVPSRRDDNYIFISNDGGLTWQQSDKEQFLNNSNIFCSEPSDNLQHSDVWFRWNPETSIERSTDYGQTWQEEYRLKNVWKEAHFYRYKLRGGRFCGREVIIKPGPFSAIYDASSNNVIFAMGWGGILVRTPEGEYHWVSVGNDYSMTLSDISTIFQAIIFDLYLALSFAILAILGQTTYTFHKSTRNRIYVGLIVAVGFFMWTWMYWHLTYRGGNLPYWDKDGTTDQTFYVFVPLTLLISIASVILLKNARRNFNIIKLQTSFIVAASLAYIIPIILWSQGIIYQYTLAHLLAILLALSVVATIFIVNKVQVINK